MSDFKCLSQGVKEFLKLSFTSVWKSYIQLRTDSDTVASSTFQQRNAIFGGNNFTPDAIFVVDWSEGTT